MSKTRWTPFSCPSCAGEPEAGWIETINNGPIVSCPLCNDDGAFPRGRYRQPFDDEYFDAHTPDR